MSAFAAIVRRDLILAVRHRAEALNPLLIFLVSVSLPRPGLSPRREAPALVAPGVVRIGTLPAALPSLERPLPPTSAAKADRRPGKTPRLRRTDGGSRASYFGNKGVTRTLTRGCFDRNRGRQDYR